MKTSIKDVSFAVFFLIIIAVVAVQAAEDEVQEGGYTKADGETANGSQVPERARQD